MYRGSQIFHQSVAPNLKIIQMKRNKEEEPCIKHRIMKHFPTLPKYCNRTSPLNPFWRGIILMLKWFIHTRIYIFFSKQMLCLLHVLINLSCNYCTALGPFLFSTHLPLVCLGYHSNTVKFISHIPPFFRSSMHR